MGVEILDGILRRYVGRDLKRHSRDGTVGMVRGWLSLETNARRREAARYRRVFFSVWVMGTWLTSEEL